MCLLSGPIEGCDWRTDKSSDKCPRCGLTHPVNVECYGCACTGCGKAEIVSGLDPEGYCAECSRNVKSPCPFCGADTIDWDEEEPACEACGWAM